MIVCGRRQDRIDELRARFPEIVGRVCDVTDEGQRLALAEWAGERHPAANVLVNNAGIQQPLDLTRPLDMAKVRAEVATNLVAPLHLASLFAPLLARNGGAAIVNVTSGLAFAPLAFMPLYCATKAALHSLSLSMRRQLRDLGVRVYEIAPPSVDSELGRDRWAPGQTSHGGMPVAEFVQEMLKALEADLPEAAIGQSARMREQREAMFDILNK